MPPVAGSERHAHVEVERARARGYIVSKHVFTTEDFGVRPFFVFLNFGVRPIFAFKNFGVRRKYRKFATKSSSYGRYRV